MPPFSLRHAISLVTPLISRHSLTADDYAMPPLRHITDINIDTLTLIAIDIAIIISDYDRVISHTRLQPRRYSPRYHIRLPFQRRIAIISYDAISIDYFHLRHCFLTSLASLIFIIDIFSHYADIFSLLITPLLRQIMPLITPTIRQIAYYIRFHWIRHQPITPHYWYYYGIYD